jgi:branched-chain amino acid transport system substrate-binding protein
MSDAIWVSPRQRFAARSRFVFLIMAVSGLLAACNPLGGPGGRDLKVDAPPAAQNGSSDANEQIGSGATRIGLVVPLTQSSGASVVGASLRNAAKLAYAESGVNDVTILVKDDRSSPAGAQAATQAAINEGAEIILGPVFAGNVKEAGRIARSAGKPVIAFTTDASAAGRGVYVLSFPAEDSVERLIAFAAQKGKKSIAALVPENDYGTVALAQFQQSAAAHDMRVLTIERYKPGAVAESVRRIAAVSAQIDSLFVPEQVEAMAAVSKELQAAGLNSKKVQIFGTGLWDDARVLKLPGLQGAWFAGRDNGGFIAFTQRYRAKFNSDPAPIATLAYDAVSLAIALSRSQGSQRYSDNVLTNRSGFIGVDGVFRFKADGTNERGLAVFEISGGGTKNISHAPSTFNGNGA